MTSPALELQASGSLAVCWNQDHENAVVITDPQRLESELVHFLHVPVLAVDFETVAIKPDPENVRLVSISTPERTLVVDLFNDGLELAQFVPILESAEVLLGHDLRFELGFLLAAGFDLRKTKYFDTIIAARVLSSGASRRGHDLKTLVSQHLSVELKKEHQKDDWRISQLLGTQWAYSAKDSAILFQLAQALISEIEEADLLETVELEMRVFPVVQAMERRGMLVDVAAWRSQLHIIKQQKQKLEKMIFKSWREFNLNSEHELKTKLAQHGYVVPNVQAATLSRIPDETVKLIVNRIPLAKFVSAFGEKLLAKVEADGRLRAVYKQLGTATGRFSAEHPNLQQIPTGKLRSVFVAPAGHKLISADYGQIELRIIAEIAGAESMLSIFKDGGDIHTHTAALFLNGQNGDHKARHKAKAVNFGLIYGMGARRLVEYARDSYGVIMSLAEAEQLKEAFFAGYPEIKVWQESQQDVTDIRTLGGRRRLPVEGNDNGLTYWQKLNSPVQGTGADIMKRALVLLESQLDRGARIVGTVHDEVLLEVPAEKAHEAAFVVKELMQEAGRLYLCKVPIVVDVRVGDSWGGAGLVEEKQIEAHAGFAGADELEKEVRGYESSQ